MYWLHSRWFPTNIFQLKGNSKYATESFFKCPWKSFFTSLPVWAIIVANFCRSWTFYMLIISQSKEKDTIFPIMTSETGYFPAIASRIGRLIQVPIWSNLVNLGSIQSDTLESGPNSFLIWDKMVYKLYICISLTVFGRYFRPWPIRSRNYRFTTSSCHGYCGPLWWCTR